MIWLRSCVFQVLFYVWTVVLGIVTLPALILPRAIPRAVGRLWVNGTFWLLRHTVRLDYRIEGQRPEGGEPMLYAIKHQSAWDTLVLMRLFEDPAIVMKRELLRLPFLGWYFRKLGMIAIDRSGGASEARRMIRDVSAALENGRPVVQYSQWPQKTDRQVMT